MKHLLTTVVLRPDGVTHREYPPTSNAPPVSPVGTIGMGALLGGTRLHEVHSLLRGEDIVTVALWIDSTMSAEDIEAARATLGRGVA